MDRHIAHIGTLTIAITTVNSNVITDDAWKHASGFIFEGGATAFTGTVTIRGLPIVDTTFANLRPLQLNGTVVVAVGIQQLQWDISGLASIAAQSDAAGAGFELAARTIEVYAVYRM